jgi:hypothetical protein
MFFVWTAHFYSAILKAKRGLAFPARFVSTPSTMEQSEWLMGNILPILIIGHSEISVGTAEKASRE